MLLFCHICVQYMKLHKDCKLRTGQTDIEVLFSTLGFKWNNKMYCKVSLVYLRAENTAT